MISFFHFNNGDNEEDMLSRIKSQMPGQYVTLQNICKKKNNNQDFYMICRFVKEVSSNKDLKFEKVMEFSFCETEHILNIFFKNDLSEKIEKVMLEGKLSIGDFVTLQRPTVAVEYENCQVRSVYIEVGNKHQNVSIWKNTSVNYVEPFLMQSTLVKDYDHILFHEVDGTGSREHVMANLCTLATAEGPIKLLSQIADTNANCVALASFIAPASPLPLNRLVNRKRRCNPSVQIKFDEISFQSKPHYFSTFTAFFCDELASEVERAVIDGDIEQGDLVILRYPRFKRKTAAPINMHFPPREKINLIVLKNQYQSKKIGDKLSLSDINLNFLNSRQEIEDNTTDYSPLQFSCIKTCFDGDDALLKICSKIKKDGEVSTVSKMTKNNSQPLKNGIILSYFLKFVSSSRVLDEQNKVTIFVREIYSDCTYGEFGKLILHGKFAKSFFLAIKNKYIVRGDIICILNPILWKNHGYVQSIMPETDVVNVIEIAIPEKQKIVVFKLREIGETKGFKKLQEENCTVKNTREADRAATISSNRIPNITTQNNKGLIIKILDNIFLGNSIPDKSAPTKSRPDIRIPDNTSLGNSIPDKSVPTKSRPDIRIPDNTNSIPDKSVPNKSRPDIRIPDNTSPGNSIPDKSAPTKSRPDIRITDNTSPGNSIPDKSAPTKSRPDIRIPDNTYPANSIPNKSAPSKSRPDIRIPDNTSPGNSIPDKSASTSSSPDIRVQDNRIPYQLVMLNPKLISDKCFFKSKYTDKELKSGFPTHYRSIFSLLPIAVSKPALKPSVDLVSGYCVSCEQMYPYSSTIGNPNNSLKRFCPNCFKVLKLDFCLELIAVGADKPVTALLHGTSAEKYLNITCIQFLSYNDTCRELVVSLLKEKLKHNESTGEGNTIQTTDCLFWEWCRPT